MYDQEWHEYVNHVNPVVMHHMARIFRKNPRFDTEFFVALSNVLDVRTESTITEFMAQLTITAPPTTCTCLGSGSFGAVYSTPNPVNLNQSYATKILGNQFILCVQFDTIMEILLHGLLYAICDMEKIPVIPILHNVVSDGRMLYVSMPIFEITLFSLIQERGVHVNDLYDILCQVSYYLMKLQTTIGFMHRDLHIGNIMLTTRPRVIPTEYGTSSNYNVFLIDFGQSCLQYIGTNRTISGRAVSYDERCDVYTPETQRAACTNFSHDLRLLMASLQTIVDVFDDYLVGTSVQTYSRWQDAYAQITVVEDTFLPHKV